MLGSNPEFPDRFYVVDMDGGLTQLTEAEGKRVRSAWRNRQAGTSPIISFVDIHTTQFDVTAFAITAIWLSTPEARASVARLSAAYEEEVERNSWGDSNEE